MAKAKAVEEPHVPSPSRNLLVLQGEFAQSFEDVMDLASMPPPDAPEELAQYNAELEARLADFAITTENAEKKVDGIATLAKATTKLAEWHKEEAGWHSARAKALEGTRKRVLDWVGVCMTALHVKEFLGRTFKLRQQDNTQSALIEHPEDVRPLPEQYTDFMVDADWEVIEFLRDALKGALDPDAEPLTGEGVEAITQQADQMHELARQRRLKPNTKLIKAACDDGIDVPGYETTKGTHVRVY